MQSIWYASIKSHFNSRNDAVNVIMYQFEIKLYNTELCTWILSEWYIYVGAQCLPSTKFSYSKKCWCLFNFINSITKIQAEFRTKWAIICKLHTIASYEWCNWQKKVVKSRTKWKEKLHTLFVWERRSIKHKSIQNCFEELKTVFFQTNEMSNEHCKENPIYYIESNWAKAKKLSLCISKSICVTIYT